LFFKTDLGIAMRVTGNNPNMAAANGVNVGRMTIFGVALANGLVGVSGGLVAQYQGFADIGMGIGTVVIGLAAVIIGESILRTPSMYAKVLSVLIGSVIFRLIIAIALFVGMNPIDLKLLTAGFVLITLIISKTVAGRKEQEGTFPKAAGFSG
jgi:putative ABC transport system permease protein